jgi:hypothetical protein
MHTADHSDRSFIGINIEGLLRPCEIYPVRVAFGHGYVWEWAAVERSTHSERSFDMFYDCLDDARQHGYEPHFLDNEETADISLVPVIAPSD